ncbi:unnamed protein product [Heterobilharzia americana]|nr:unnamed protein product [Heterobilharzia americana]
MNFDNKLHKYCDKIQSGSNVQQMKKTTKLMPHSKLPINPIIKMKQQSKNGIMNSNQLQQKSNTVESFHRTVSNKSCRLQDLCSEDRRKLTTLIMKLAEAQEDLKRMNRKFEKQSINSITNNDYDNNTKVVNSSPLVDNEHKSNTHSRVEEYTTHFSKAEQLIIFYQTKLKELESELSELRDNFKGEHFQQHSENDLFMKQSVEIVPSVINDVKQMEEINHSEENINKFDTASLNNLSMPSLTFQSFFFDHENCQDCHCHNKTKNFHTNNTNGSNKKDSKGAYVIEEGNEMVWMRRNTDKDKTSHCLCKKDMNQKNNKPEQKTCIICDACLEIY